MRRITSYNVCYTKLLRNFIDGFVFDVKDATKEFDVAVLIDSKCVAEIKPTMKQKHLFYDVITSYSIHYTKLYDCFCGGYLRECLSSIKPLPPECGSYM